MSNKKIALVGNPNCGKTTIFNGITGAHQHVGNWGGVTVDIKEGDRKINGTEYTFVDLPGTYSLSAFSMEEKVARDYIIEERPDLVVNVVDGTNLERSLYFTVQLLELGVRPLLVVNMWDEVQKKGISVDLKRLGELLGLEIITAVGKTGKGLDQILTEVEKRDGANELEPFVPHLSPELADAHKKIITGVCECCLDGKHLAEWIAIKLLEKDIEVEKSVGTCEEGRQLIKKVSGIVEEIESLTGDDPETLISEARYGYATGVVRETVTRDSLLERVNISDKIDAVLTHKVWALPIFAFFLWALFQLTFTLGGIPMGWIESLFGWLGEFAGNVIPEGLFRDLVVDGIIAGVGGVAVFLPNILILFFGISMMEDTGYMARAAFIMDKFMHKIGLHGKSFIPMIMGMGCTVPAVMAARTLESPRDRIKTILLTPLISCGARLPVYVLMAGALFPKQAGNVVFLFNVVFGFTAFGLMALLFKHTLFKNVEEIPFVMELPPYRLPTAKSVMIHMWHKAEHYIVKMGTVVLFFSILLWFAMEFPRNETVMAQFESKFAAVEQSTLSEEAKADSLSILEVEQKSELQKHTVLGKIGHVLEPTVRPFGTDWRGAVSLITGFVAKEVVVGSMGVLYNVGVEEDAESSTLQDELRNHFTPLSAIAFMFFVLLYTPCVVALTTIIKELNNWKWSTFSVIYQLSLAWGVATVVYQVGRLLGF